MFTAEDSVGTKRPLQAEHEGNITQAKGESSDEDMDRESASSISESCSPMSNGKKHKKELDKDDDEDKGGTEMGGSSTSCSGLVKKDCYVLATYSSTEKYFAKVKKVHKDGTCDVEYVDDLIFQKNVEVSFHSDAATALEKRNWACCDKCDKWRFLPVGMETFAGKFECELVTWAGPRDCLSPEEDGCKDDEL